MINNKSLDSKKAMTALVEAYWLYMHATPYYRGTPSIVEAFFDAIIRAKYGKTFPGKIKEPFWEFTLRVTLPTLEDFLNCFAR